MRWVPGLVLGDVGGTAAADRGELCREQEQCYVQLSFPDLRGRAVRLEDLMGPASYDRDGSGLVSRGLYLDVPEMAIP